MPMTKKLLILVFALCTLGLSAQSVTEQYIADWHEVAQAEMLEYGIPASITLAQGILESGSGQSKLAKEANNHFGIKCHLDWKGEKVYHDDDEDDECFRKYDHAEDSFRDHSRFLKERSRYAKLFDLKSHDYKSWAKGLKKAGYATNPKYADLLIDLIERHKLHKYDVRAVIKTNPPKEVPDPADLLVQESPNKVDFVIARKGDTFESLAEYFNKRTEDLLEYNELRYDAKLEPGQIIYLQPKRSRAARENRYYTFVEGDDLYEISQRYAIKLEKIYQRNDIPVGETPKPGTRLELR
ncbi:glucosaminidase domain-containing protein [Croceimicrobium hydrocarbonivorans]|uniref:Peptidoglycan hydrolase n=2 Tax=Croceimicrobium hydrocarbonivorans TaxID=2761580 RepID=A0A7H0VHZ7_9FLAO|nr:glucosaminidase domain-containing protein [Croceimicrobium hydrocarbonivorans]